MYDDTCHPSFYEIGKLGCNDPTKITVAFHAYIELCEAKRLWNVKYKYNKELDLLYLEAQSGRNSLPQIYVPWSTVNAISLNRIDQIQQRLHSDRLIFIFKEGDSSSVYYRVSAGLVKPMAPEVTKQLKQIEDKRTALEKEIRKNTSNLYELAKSIGTGNTVEMCNLDE